MRGILGASACWRASFRGQRRVNESFQLLITKKPVEYDYVAIDVNAFIGAAARIARTVPEQRRHKEVGRHVLNAIQQILRRIVCRRSLLLAFDGAGTMAKAYRFRSGPTTRRHESRSQRLPGSPMMLAVEDRVLKAMPFARGLIPSEVVLSGLGVEGPVERKVAAWALDLACRDGARRHTTNSLCVIGGGDLWMSVLALTPYVHGTSVIQGGNDLQQLPLSELMKWLELDDTMRSGNMHQLTVVRTDTLLLYLLANGSSVTELAPIFGASFAVLMSAYQQLRQMAGTEGVMAVTPITPTASGHSNGVAAAERTATFPFELLRDGAGGRLELDVQQLLLLFVPEKDYEAEMQLLGMIKDGVSSPPLATSAPEAGPEQGRSDPICDGYLNHLLTTHHLFCHGETIGHLSLPSYLEAEVAAAASTHRVASLERRCPISVSDWIRYLRRLLRAGHRYVAAGEVPTTEQQLSPNRTPASEREVGSKTMEKAQSETACMPVEEGSSTTVRDGSICASLTPALPPPTPAFYPFWTAHQPLTAAEYTLLCVENPTLVEALLRIYAPGLILTLRPEVIRTLTSAQTKFSVVHDLLQRIFSYVPMESPHPSLCLSPSYHWTQNEKSKLWSFRYVDLGIVAKQQNIRHNRSFLEGMMVEQKESSDDAVAFDVHADAWLPLHHTFLTDTTSGANADEVAGEDPSAILPSTTSSASMAILRNGGDPQRVLRVLTWNVMFDRYSGQPTPLGMPGIDWCSPQRYPVLAKLIDAEDADVVGMQEVERPFAEYLAEQAWCRERYILSCRPSSSILDPWGVILLLRRGGRWRLKQLTYLNVPAWSGHVSLMPVATLEIPPEGDGPDGDEATTAPNLHKRKSSTPPRQLNVCSMHLLAPFVKSHEVARTGQDQALRLALTRQLHGDTIVMGDFNDWPGNEFVMPSETRYRECWPLVHPDQYGKTMDESNTFCKLKIEEIFFGRSDKVFLRTGSISGSLESHHSDLLTPIEAHLVGTRSVNDENGNHDAPAYLFPSDHYGVSMLFQVR